MAARQLELASRAASSAEYTYNNHPCSTCQLPTLFNEIQYNEETMSCALPCRCSKRQLTPGKGAMRTCPISCTKLMRKRCMTASDQLQAYTQVMPFNEFMSN